MSGFDDRDEVGSGRGDASIDVRAEAETLLVPRMLTPAGTLGGGPGGFATRTSLVRLGRERLEARARVRVARGEDDDRGDAHRSSR